MIHFPGLHGVQSQIGCSMHEGMEFRSSHRLILDPSVIGQLRYLDDIRVSIDHNAPEVGDAVHLPIAGY